MVNDAFYETNDNGTGIGFGEGSIKHGHRTTQSEQLYEADTISTPSGVIRDGDEDDDEVTPGMNTNRLDLAEDDDSDNVDRMYVKTDNITQRGPKATEGDSDTGSNDEMHARPSDATKGQDTEKEKDDADNESPITQQ